VKFEIEGESGRLEFRVQWDGSQRADEADLIWLPSECRCSVGPFTAAFSLSVTDQDLRSIKAELEGLSRGTACEAAIANLEEDFHCKFAVTKVGAIIIECRLNPRVWDSATLTFIISSDLPTIERAVKDINHILRQIGDAS
jgi:hypothetical protein